MANTITPALSGEQVLHSSSLATVTENCIVIPSPEGRSQTVISTYRVTKVKTIKTTFPGLLVVSSALFIMAAAAQFSRDGGGAAIPIGVLGGLSVLGYVVTRKGAVALVVDGETTETMQGSLSEAAALVVAIRSAQAIYNQSASTTTIEVEPQLD